MQEIECLGLAKQAMDVDFVVSSMKKCSCRSILFKSSFKTRLPYVSYLFCKICFKLASFFL